MTLRTLIVDDESLDVDAFNFAQRAVTKDGQQVPADEVFVVPRGGKF